MEQRLGKEQRTGKRNFRPGTEVRPPVFRAYGQKVGAPPRAGSVRPSLCRTWYRRQKWRTLTLFFAPCPFKEWPRPELFLGPVAEVVPAVFGPIGNGCRNIRKLAGEQDPWISGKPAGPDLETGLTRKGPCEHALFPTRPTVYKTNTLS